MKTKILVLMLVLSCTQKPTEPPAPVVAVVNVGPDNMVLPFEHMPFLAVGGGTAGGSAGGTSAGGGTPSMGGGAPTGGGTMMALDAGAARRARRLTVEQVEGSLNAVLQPDYLDGGFGDAGLLWLDGTKDAFITRAQTLGQPDYNQLTEENLESSPLYLKFMGDMARSACTRADIHDARVTLPNRMLGRFADVDANLRYLKLRFHGVDVAPTDTVSISEYRTLYMSSLVLSDGGTSTREAWKTVCVALLLAPEFHLY